MRSSYYDVNTVEQPWTLRSPVSSMYTNENINDLTFCKLMMKKIFILFPILILIIYAYSVCAKTDDAQIGIKFFEGTWNEALVKSAKENKPIFLDVATSWCGYCKKLKQNTFTDKKVGTYFNKRFINIELDGEHGEGLRLAHKFGVSEYPTILLLDKNENSILH